ncbi:MAG: DUF4340 domain-containing protein [Chloroflexi bacterium]|nr:DUF4340 domain-containing protein [Chloroflexota bacterium]
MLKRSNVLLAIVLVAQLILLAISVVTSSSTEARPAEPILAGMTAADVERISFADELDNEVIFARGEAGWVLPGADGFPVEAEKVDELLDKIANLDTRRLIATNPVNFARLEVADDDFRRKLSLESGEAAQLLYLGGSGGVDTVYLRRAGEDNVYLGLGLSSWELSTQTSTWLDANYVNAPLADVVEIRVENADGVFTFLRDGDSWRYAELPEGAAFEDTKMPIVSRNAASVRLLEPLGLEALDEYGLDDPQAVVHVRYRQAVESAEPVADQDADGSREDEDGSSTGSESEAAPEFTEAAYTLTFGAQLEDGVVLKSSAAEYYVLARETVFKAFKDLKSADLIKPSEAEGAGLAEPASE